MRDNKAEIKRFLDIKEANGQSSYTIRSQTDVLMKLYHFLESKPFREATEEDIVSFLSEMGKKHAPSTMKLIKMVIKSFYRHLYGMKKHEFPSQVQNINSKNNHERKIPIRPEHVLTKEDIAEIVRHCDNFRDKAIVTVLYETGARIGEFAGMNIEHVKFDNKGAVLVIEGKTGSRRIRLIESVPFLQRWIESHPRRRESNAPLWCLLTHKARALPFNTKETYGEMFGEAYFQVQYFNGVTYEDVAKGGSNPENLDGKPLLGRGYWIFVLEPMTLHLTEELYQSEP